MADGGNAWRWDKELHTVAVFTLCACGRDGRHRDCCDQLLCDSCHGEALDAVDAGDY